MEQIGRISMNQEQIRVALPENVKYIIETIETAGFEAFAVGGCVRDSILGKEPNDWDITTSALPGQVKALFGHTIDTGIQHGTVTVMRHHQGYEVTTYRIDGEYEDSRHPKEVSFTANLVEDLKRRDFTINAMAYNEKQGIVDEFHGIEDLQNGIIRAVGDPLERFTEDALRIMRAVRFAAQLGYEIEAETKKAISILAPNLAQISAERIQVEFTKLLVSSHPEQMRVLYETGITAVVMPEFDRIMETEQNNPHHCYSVGEHSIHAMQEIESGEESLKYLRFAMLFHDFGKAEIKTVDDAGIDHFHGHATISEELTRTILRRLKFDNDTISVVTKLVKCHDAEVEAAPKYVRRAINRMGEDIFPLILRVKRADVMAQSTYKRAEKLQKLSELESIYQEIIKQKECVSLKTLAVTGKDLIEAGVKPGKEIGTILKEMLELVLEEPDRNQKENLMQYLFTRQK